MRSDFRLFPLVGTPATTSQMAKDVGALLMMCMRLVLNQSGLRTVTFLSFAAEPELDERKQLGFQAVVILSALTALSIW